METALSSSATQGQKRCSFAKLAIEVSMLQSTSNARRGAMVIHDGIHGWGNLPLPVTLNGANNDPPKKKK